MRFGGNIVNKSKKIVRVEEQNKKKVKVSNHDTKRMWEIIGAAAAIIFVIAICVVIGYDSFHKNPIVTVDGKEYKITSPEVRFNVYMGEASLASNAAMYSQYGMSADEFYSNYSGYQKSSTLQAIEEGILMSLEAEKNGEKLSDEDKKSVTEEYGKIYDKMSKKRQKKLGLSKEEFVEQALKSKLVIQYEEKLRKGYNVTKETLATPVDKSKFDERAFDVIQVKTTTVDEDNKTKDVSKKDKDAYVAKMNEYLKDVKAGKDMSKLVSEKDSKTYVYTTKSLLTSDTTYANLIKKVKDMKNGEVFNEVIDADGYLWVVKMKDNKATTQYDEAVKNAITQEETAKFNKDIEAAKKTYSLKEGKGWADVDFGKVIVKQGDDMKEFQADPTPTPAASATPAATEKASATPAATEKAKATQAPTASPETKK